MKTAVVFDCEFLTSEGAQRRFWCGPFDPDPVIAQIGAVKLSLEGSFELIDTIKVHINPVDRYGDSYKLDPFFSKLTGITQEMIDSEGISLQEVNEQLNAFADGATLWSWGKDELNMMAISCYIAGIQPSIPAHQFDNACKLMLAAGMPYEDIKRTRSNDLADYFELEHPPLRGHDALDDALSVAYVIQHLLRNKRLSPAEFERGGVELEGLA
ncbi:3'-5' exonuclease [Pseudovibrio sp. JE062]|uniref:3'-5' exonuclease n=1 Tax=Pseudovibrio sp. JE062 TaxID=439495 RepID=UPI000560287A|nr:3'-5' exonuclease [Pseudovibrio sp. JE062]